MTRAAKCINNAGVVNEWSRGNAVGLFCLGGQWGGARGGGMGAGRCGEKLYAMLIWVIWVIDLLIYKYYEIRQEVHNADTILPYMELERLKTGCPNDPYDP